MGYRADVAGNGLEVLEALRRQPYHVVLMDVQMPEMDGLAATRCICQEWPLSQRPRIIAMTANAMLGDRELCLEAGMDDYISKPIRVEELVSALSKCQEELEVESSPNGLPVSQLKVPGSENHLQPDNPKPSTSNNSTAAIDTKVFQELREMVNNDQVLAGVVDRYIEESPDLLQSLTEALAQGEAEVLHRVAHTLKSTSAMLGATSLSQLCQELELSGQNRSLASLDAMVYQVKTEYEKVQTALQQRRQQLSST
jgi:CheY-like chemotaxis protein